MEPKQGIKRKKTDELKLNMREREREREKERERERERSISKLLIINRRVEVCRNASAGKRIMKDAKDGRVCRVIISTTGIATTSLSTSRGDMPSNVPY